VASVAEEMDMYHEEEVRQSIRTPYLDFSYPYCGYSYPYCGYSYPVL
jgi:hypothetical protein